MMDISEVTQHRWYDILTTFGVDQKVLNKRHQACPFCGGKDRFRWTDYMGTGGFICNQCGSGDGFEFLMRITGKEFKDIANDVRGIVGETVARVSTGTDVSKTRQKLTAMWRETLPLSKGDPVHLYLLNRGLKGLSFGELKNLRYHPALTYWDQQDGKPVKCGDHPCMVGMVMTPDGEPATLHVTYLQPDGRKAAVENVRKTMTAAKNWDGGAVRLGDVQDGQVLCVAEGIETALSMKLLFPDLCPWACISAGKLEKFIPPNDSGTLYIAADNDISYTGMASAMNLAKRLSGKCEVSVITPEIIGTDMNDVLQENRGFTVFGGQRKACA